ncbi:MAG: arginine--tRNA ligase [Candidatus Eremiobacteraeota bacterium]|nr:arginine--tRNA ligase [Candidatus Eremiobacteraeota bacterium]
MNPTTTSAHSPLPEEALNLLRQALLLAIAARYPDAAGAEVAFESPRRVEFGDFSTNVALSLARTARTSPQNVATALVDDVRGRDEFENLFTAMEAVGGFINVRIAAASWQALLADMLRRGAHFGESPKNGQRISLEFGSANPTGPLVVVQGRTLSIGETLADALRFCGYDVFVEWIINDAGGQIETLGRSLYARYRQTFDPTYTFPEEGYPGDYLVPIADAIRQTDGERWIAAPEAGWLPYFCAEGRERLVAGQRATVERFGVRYDLWQSEKELHDDGRVRAGIDRLIDLGLTYEQDGALYFRATAFNDDKDRVLIRSDGRPTYLCADVAYHYEKLQRADRVIDILGPDHHGYIGRLQGLATALGYPGKLDVLIAQQITLMRGDQQVSMSKRAGQIVTLDDIIDEVGVDAARFFFVMLAPESPLTFDLALAAQKSSDNPVYYVQYGHARIASLLKNAVTDDVAVARGGATLERLVHPAELALVRRLAELPSAVRNAVDHLAPHRLTRYARDVASDFHQFYAECRVLTDDREERLARLSLCLATESVLARVLGILGVSAPESM